MPGSRTTDNLINTFITGIKLNKTRKAKIFYVVKILLASCGVLIVVACLISLGVAYNMCRKKKKASQSDLESGGVNISTMALESNETKSWW